jgi:hypothetical protein
MTQDTDDVDGVFGPRYLTPAEVPNLTAKQVKANVAERHKAEGMLDINGGRELGPNPKLYRGKDPNNLWDRATNRFIPNTASRGYR